MRFSVIAKRVQVEADLLRRVSVNGPPTMIVVLGIGQQISMYELNNIASWPYDRNVFVIRSFDDLPAVESRLSNAICGCKSTLHGCPLLAEFFAFVSITLLKFINEMST